MFWPFYRVAEFFAKQIWYFGQISVLNVKENQCFFLHFSLFLAGHFANLWVQIFRLYVIFHHINKRTLDDLKYCFIEFKSLFDGYLNINKFIFPLNKFVKRLQLPHIFFPKPFSYSGQLSPDGSFLVSIELFYLNIALVSQILFNFVDGCVINGLHGVSIKFSVALYKKSYMSG